MNVLQGALLGLVQGLGEFLPVSSSGHLLLLTLVTGNAQERRITRDECTSLNAVAESMARQSNENI